MEELYREAASEFQNDCQSQAYQYAVKEFVHALTPSFRAITWRRIFYSSRSVQDDIKDILQETFKTICCQDYKEFPNTDSGNEHLRNYLYMILKNKIYDFNNGKWIKNISFSLDDNTEKFLDFIDGFLDEDDFIQAQYDKFIIKEIKQKIKNLKSSCKEIIRLRIYEKLPYEMIANKSGIEDAKLREEYEEYLRKKNRVFSGSDYILYLRQRLSRCLRLLKNKTIQTLRIKNEMQ